MQRIVCFRVDEWDGGERHHFKFYITDKNEADAYLQKNKFDTITPVVLMVFDTLAEVEEFSINRLKESALAKLTPEERMALGHPAH